MTRAALLLALAVLPSCGCATLHPTSTTKGVIGHDGQIQSGQVLTGGAHPTNALAALPRYPLVSATDPEPLRVSATAPVTLGKPGCCPDTMRARSWMRLEVAVQQRAVDWAHPRFDPQIVATGPLVAPGTACTLSVNRQQPGDVLIVRFVNGAGAACWGGWANGAVSWRRVDAGR